jgi:hypothetical protein
VADRLQLTVALQKRVLHFTPAFSLIRVIPAPSDYTDVNNGKLQLRQKCIFFHVPGTRSRERALVEIGRKSIRCCLNVNHRYKFFFRNSARIARQPPGLGERDYRYRVDQEDSSSTIRSSSREEARENASSLLQIPACHRKIGRA